MGLWVMYVKSILIYEPHEFSDLDTEDVGGHNSGETSYKNGQFRKYQGSKIFINLKEEK
jgi:hypothetical protein